MKMRKRSILILVFLLSFFCVSSVFARNGIYLGLQGGFSAQKPSLKNVEFNTDTTFLYGVRAGVRFMMVALELKPSAGTARKYTEMLMDLGVLAKDTHGQTIRFAPPLVVTQEELDWAVGRLEHVLKSI